MEKNKHKQNDSRPCTTVITSNQSRFTMKHIRCLASLSKEEIINFINSFDYVFSDIDGVLLLAATPLPGANECIDKLKTLGKSVGFVTNNTISSMKVLKEELRHFEATEHEIVTPVLSAIAYLKKIQCPKDIFCIAGHELVSSLRLAGYNIVNIEVGELKEDMTFLRNVCMEFMKKSMNTGAIVMDLDVNFRLIQAEAAILLLTRNPAMPFLVAATDDSGPLSENIEFIGNKFYVEAIERITKTKCKILAKPSIELKHYLEARFEIPHEKRVLFIGDSLTSDITFANRAGFQSLLVLSGQTKLDDLVNWKHEEENRPDYYINSLGCFSRLLGSLNIT